MQPLSYNQIVEEFNKLLTLTPKERYKKIQTVAYHAGEALATTTNLDEIGFYITIFKKAFKNKLLNKAKLREFELKGITEIKTLKTQLKDVEIESGMIGVGDPTLAYTEDYDQKKVIEGIKQCRFYCGGTGGDGTFGVILRLIDAPEPLAGIAEYKFIINNSSISTVEIKSGRVKCTDFFGIGKPDWAGAEYEIPNGFYDVCIYMKDIKDKFFGFVVVLSKTNTIHPETLELTDFQSLG